MPHPYESGRTSPCRESQDGAEGRAVRDWGRDLPGRLTAAAPVRAWAVEGMSHVAGVWTG